MSPLPLGVLCAALLVGSVSLSNPFAVAACAAVAAALLVASPPPRGAYIWFAAGSALLVFAGQPVRGRAGADADLERAADPAARHRDDPGGAGVRVGGGSADRRVGLRGRRIRAAGRRRPRAGRGGPGGAALGHDRRAGVAAAADARARRGRPDAGRARTRGASSTGAAPAAALAAPLVALSLERSLSLAEAMEARGYGGGPRTRTPGRRCPAPRAAAAGDRRVLPAWSRGGARAGAGGYRYYDLLDDPLTAAGLGDHGGAAGAGGAGRGGDGAMAALSFEDVSYRYPDAARPALDGVTLEVEPGRAGAAAGRVGLRQVDAASGGAGAGAPLPRRRAERAAWSPRAGHARAPAARDRGPGRAGVPGSRSRSW